MRHSLVMSAIGVMIMLLFTPVVASARSTFKDVGRNFVDAGEIAYGGQPPSLEKTVGAIIKSGLGLLGVVFIVLIVYSGYLWMTARGEDKQVTKAKDTITSAIIGLAITLGAYAITDFVTDSLITATGI